MDLQIVEYEPRHAMAFRKLNLAWLREYFEVEPFDQEELYDPQTTVLDPGGKILVAELEGEAVGVTALLYISEGYYELSKMAVDLHRRGHGIGRMLLAATIDYARDELDAHKIMLLSARKLKPAIHLYREFGFVEIPVPADQVYARVDIAMELVLFTDLRRSVESRS